MAETTPFQLFFPLPTDPIKSAEVASKLANDLKNLALSANQALVMITDGYDAQIAALDLKSEQHLTADVTGYYDHLVSASWNRYTKDYVQDIVGETVGAPQKLIPYFSSMPRLIDGLVHPSLIPPLAYAKLDGSTPFSLVRIGDSVILKEVQGARGHRLQFKSNDPGNENARPYLEVDASPEDWKGDVIAGFQCHVEGDGSTPNSGERVYWFLEAHGLEHTANSNPDFEGWYSIGVSNRAELTARGKGRALILDAGNRPGMAMHFYKPYIELQPNTAFTLDDRARPAWGDGSGVNHAARTVGTLIGGHYINLRREGVIGARFFTLHNTASTSPETLNLRSRGTAEAPLPVQSGDRLSAWKSGTVYNVSSDYVHIPNGGAGPANIPSVSAQILAVATENFVEGTNQGTRQEFHVTPNGSASPVAGMMIDGAETANDTSLLLRVDKAGTKSLTRVSIGAPDSGGPGKRALTIPN